MHRFRKKPAPTCSHDALAHKGHSIRSEVGGVQRTETMAGGTSYDFQLQTVVAALASDETHPNEGNDPIGNMRAIDAIYDKAGFGPR